MKTPESLNAFLSSLAPITASDYQIRHGGGNVLYSTSGNKHDAAVQDRFNQIARQIIEDNCFSYNTTAPQQYLCGCPITIGTSGSAALLAHGAIAADTDTQQHRSQLKQHLHQTISLIEENQNYRVEIEELAQQLELSFEDLYLYSQISDQIKSLTLSKQMLNNLMMKIVENMHVDAAFISLPQRPQFDMEIYRPVSHLGPTNWQNFIDDLQTLARPHLDRQEENYIIINDSREQRSYQELAALPYRFLMVGVRHQGELYGWIGLTSFNLQEIFRQGEFRMLRSMAEQLAIVITNTDLYNNLEQFTERMVHSLVYAIEAKDPYTRGHSERVHHFTMLIAKQLHLEDEDFESLKWAAILHDVGKIGISEKILLKPGKLTDEEFGLIKKHPEKGGRILKPVAQLTDSLDGIVHHHERFDGKGYPLGLKGEEIPLAARIIAVADTFDAITSDRVYRNGKSDQEALQIIHSVAGSQLDPGIVTIFKHIYTKKTREQQKECPCKQQMPWPQINR